MGKKNFKEELAIIAAECIKIRKALSLTSLLTPLNFLEEKDTFLNSKKYNPQFKYAKEHLPDHEKTILDLKSRILKSECPQEIQTHLLDYILDLELLDHTRRSIGEIHFADFATDLFADELEEVFHEQFLPKSFRFTNEKRGRLLNAFQIKDIFDKELQNYHLHNYEVKIIQNGPIISAGPERIVLGERIKRYENNVKCLAIHEVESHALQYYNIREAQNPILRLIKFSKMHLWSEGLAVFNEVQTQTLTKSKYETYIRRFEAVKMINNSFREIYEYLCEFVPQKDAFTIAFRVKRGLSDTSLPGGFPKDLVYILGYLKVDEYVKSGKSRSALYRVHDPNYTYLLEKYNLLAPNQIVLPKFIS